MRIINKLSALFLSVALILGLAGPTPTFAATDPDLGAAETFSIIGQTAITGTGTISGDVGMNSSGANITGLTGPMVGGTIYSTDGVAPSTAILDAAVQANLSTANDDITGQGSDGSIGPALDGLTVSTGVWDIGAGRLNGGVLTLDGPGTYIFRTSSDFISSGSIELTNGARACDVYWQVDTLATINGSSFIGTVIAGTGVHFDTASTELEGRALALGGDVTLSDTTISEPGCQNQPTLTVVKTVINGDGGTKTISDFPLFVDGASVTSGVATTTTVGVHTVSETTDPNYQSTIGGDCAADGTITLELGDEMTCTVTNNDLQTSDGGGGGGSPTLAPIIDVVKIPDPLSLPDGSGMVEYTYELSNIGEVSVDMITMSDDSCSPLVFISGDTDGDERLGVDETWTYTCTEFLSETHTNRVTATGWANGISTTDTANATVIVGSDEEPPLINVTKVPNPLALTAAGGMVTYINKVTNPGTVPLTNVRLTDDKCTPVSYVSGDVNNNSELDVNETWTYICSANLTSTTVNTVTARGDANGLTARDTAIATVILGGTLPMLPNTGIPPSESNIPWYVVVPTAIFAIMTLFYFTRRKHTA